ncbi:hypothetical protein BC833DRAFT_652386 [Globomyces pollinis-pini]|nr:hypothetical protein BC833DRAFT_652386 [Globomyces pollinis-pini]
MISYDTLNTTTMILWILIPIGFILSILVFIYIMYVSRKKRSTTYLNLIKIIAIANIPYSLQAIIMLFYPESMTMHITHRILTFIGGWSGFTSIWLFLICDMELLKLLYIITPFFTPNRIYKIQIIETIICFLLGGGVLLWPFSDLNVNGIISMWYNLIVLQQFMSTILITIQCSYISIKMYQFTLQKRGQDRNKIKRKTFRAIFQIFVFFSTCLTGMLIILTGILIFFDKSPLSRRLSNIVTSSSCLVGPFQILSYYHIFDTIVGIKFEKLQSKSIRTLHVPQK